jgi:hypothetical protein
MLAPLPPLLLPSDLTSLGVRVCFSTLPTASSRHLLRFVLFTPTSPQSEI